MKKVMLSIILTILLATAVRANQESSISYDVVTMKPEIKTRLSIDPDVKVEYIIIHSIKLFDGRDGNGRVTIDIEIVDYNGNHTSKTLEKKVDGGHGYYYEVIREETKVKGKLN